MGETTKLVLFLLVVSCSPLVFSGVVPRRFSQASSEYWNVLVLTQFWPPAGCLLVESEHKECNISVDMSSWMIHGLWPTKNGTEGPNFCNDSWVFDPKILQVLQPRLGQNWASIMKDSPSKELWEHEWDKHGTCATSLPALEDELHYFNETLNLHDRFNLAMFFEKGGITPSSDRGYKFEDVVKTVHSSTGSLPLLTCLRDKTNGKCYLEQIELCLTKSFKPADCAPTLAQSTGHDLLFRSEAALGERREGDICDCRWEEIYYKPMPSVELPFRA